MEYMAQTAIVTGGSGGIGRECVRKISIDHDILIHYHTNSDAAKSVADEIIDKYGINAITYKCDVSCEKDVQSMVQYAKEELGDIDVLVNNAGILERKSVLDMDHDHILRLLSVNLLGTMYCTKFVLPDMLNLKNGRIINVASTGGTRGSTSSPVYSASKGGMVAFTKSLARTYTSEGILSNVVAPSSTNTAMYPEAEREESRKNFPQGRMVQPEEIAETVDFLVRTSYISGEIIEVDGGKYT